LLTRLGGLEAVLESVVASWQSNRHLLQARRWHRLRFQEPLGLTPLDDAGQPAGDPWLVHGHDVSLGGVSFLHRLPLACRIAALTFPLDGGQFEAVAVRLTWCRFTTDGIYQSGGRFLRRLSAPPFDLTAWNRLSHG
jgi:hypothetical protein